MILKLFKAAWFLSLVGFLFIFLYIYASLPETVVLGDEIDSARVSRDVVFYSSLITAALVNVLVFFITKLYGKRNEEFSTWFFGQIILLNFFFCTVLGFINLLNSGEIFQYGRLGIVIYGSIILIVMWAVSWPVYSLSRKFLTKQPI